MDGTGEVTDRDDETVYSTAFTAKPIDNQDTKDEGASRSDKEGTRTLRPSAYVSLWAVKTAIRTSQMGRYRRFKPK